MPIEFRCSACQTMLRVADSTAGRQTRCPSCGAINPIPDAAPPVTPPSASYGATPDDEYPLSREEPTPQPAPDASNPYASPTFSGGSGFPPHGGGTSQEHRQHRDGPPWERDGTSAASYVETCKQVITAPGETFRSMRVTGGHGAPLFFLMIGGIAGSLVNGVYEVGMNALMGQGPLGQDQPALGGGELAVAMVIGLVCGVVLIPLVLLLQIYIFSGLTHLALQMLGGGKHEFEATLRTFCYAEGTWYWLLLIPLVGQYAHWLVSIVYCILGLIESQEISGGRATAAVLLPIGFCCTLFCGGIFAIAFMVSM